MTLSCSVLDFGHIEEGGEVESKVYLVNSSPSEAVYQWDLDGSGHSVFSIQPTEGTLRPNSQAKLRVVYRPRSPLIHHRRVACLILHGVGRSASTHHAAGVRSVTPTVYSL